MVTSQVKRDVRIFWGAPQYGHVGARLLMSLPQSLQVFNVIGLSLIHILRRDTATWSRWDALLCGLSIGIRLPRIEFLHARIEILMQFWIFIQLRSVLNGASLYVIYQ